MKITVGQFTNLTQEQVREQSSDAFICWYSSISAKDAKCSVGGVDAMMKKDIKSIVSAYQRMIAKRGYTEFPKGKYEIQIRDGFSPFNAKQIAVVEVEVA